MKDMEIGGYISKIKFINGKEYDIKIDDIVVFVGPNNAGKSQTLKDLYKLSSGFHSSVVVSAITIEKYGQDILTLLNKISKGTTQNFATIYNVLGKVITVLGNSAKIMMGRKHLVFFGMCLL